MASTQQNVKQRREDEPTMKMNHDNIKPINTKPSRRERDRKAVMAKRGLRSLAMAVALPVSLTLLTKYASCSGGADRAVYGAAKPFWFPPTWALHMTCLAVSFLMGLSAWLVWAEGGFHKKPMALYLYAAQLGLSMAWDVIVFRLGASQVGLVVCLGMFGVTFGCSKVFREVNMIAGDLVKPCLAWAAFLSIVNLNLVAVSI